jgi:TIR domain
MAVFISHSQADRGMFSTLIAALKGQNISVWDRRIMYAGKSLKDQLKEAIKTCDVSVFLATQNSLKSEWCRAEIGAFWGAGKDVVVFIYDSKISEGEVPLPPELTGDLYTTVFDDVVRAVQNNMKKGIKGTGQILGHTVKADSGKIRLSATDLANHLACHHLTSLDLAVASPTKMRISNIWQPKECQLSTCGISLMMSWP